MLDDVPKSLNICSMLTQVTSLNLVFLQVLSHLCAWLWYLWGRLNTSNICLPVLTPQMFKLLARAQHPGSLVTCENLQVSKAYKSSAFMKSRNACSEAKFESLKLSAAFQELWQDRICVDPVCKERALLFDSQVSKFKYLWILQSLKLCVHQLYFDS